MTRLWWKYPNKILEIFRNAAFKSVLNPVSLVYSALILAPV